jgi:hypothetical protein
LLGLELLGFEHELLPLSVPLLEELDVHLLAILKFLLDSSFHFAISNGPNVFELFAYEGCALVVLLPSAVSLMLLNCKNVIEEIIVLGRSVH